MVRPTVIAPKSTSPSSNLPDEGVQRTLIVALAVSALGWRRRGPDRYITF